MEGLRLWLFIETMGLFGTQPVYEVRLHVLSVIGAFAKHKPQSFHTHIRYRVVRLVEVNRNGLVPVVHYVSQVFFDAGGQGTACLTYVQFVAFEAVYDIHYVLCLAGEVFLDCEAGQVSLNCGGGTDKGAHFAFWFLTRRCSRILADGLLKF